jgi:Putative metal-binding motif
MTSYPRRVIVVIPWLISACGITIPGGLPIGSDEPGVGITAGSGATGGVAGAGAGAAGRGGAAGSVLPPAGTGGVTPVAGSGGMVAGTGGRGGSEDRDGDGFSARSDCNDLNPGVHPRAPDDCCDNQDMDCDGTDAPAGSVCSCDRPMPSRDRDRDGWTPLDGDCNDHDASFFPGNPKEGCCDGLDSDCDGRDDPQNADCDCASDFDGDGWFAGPFGGKRDCNDSNPNIHPGAIEVCGDALDNDCDGVSDDPNGCFRDDLDGDGYPVLLDCNDLNASVHPGALEWCFNGIDEDCDGLSDMQDGDCYEDNDGDGYPQGSDCNDYDASTFPGAYEPCYDGIDSNCDGRSDHEDFACRGVLQDADGDGYTQDFDCNDWDASIYPGGPEFCGDGIDNDCDGVVDRGCSEQDWDRDGYPNGKDCNDSNSDVFPGSPYERCCDGIDSDCDGTDGTPGAVCSCMSLGDTDGDGFGTVFTEPGQADCNDQDPKIFPGAPEQCGDGRDNDCDGRVDTDDRDCLLIIID